LLGQGDGAVRPKGHKAPFAAPALALVEHHHLTVEDGVLGRDVLVEEAPHDRAVQVAVPGMVEGGGAKHKTRVCSMLSGHRVDEHVAVKGTHERPRERGALLSGTDPVA
jgi:hypothetical protein